MPPKALSRKPERKKKGDVDTDEAIYNAIRQAMLMGKLPAGLNLQEPRLARALGVSRERVRKALHRLAHERWLDMIPNRGTFVPTPTIEELHNIYEARKILEVGIARKLATRRAFIDTERLNQHVASEKKAIRMDDRGRLFKLSAEFHFLLAELSGNDQLVDMLRGLLTRSSLHFSLFAPKRLHNCAGPHEHEEIADAILEGDTARAAKLMLDHLVGLETMLSVRDRVANFTSLEDVFRCTAAGGGKTSPPGGRKPAARSGGKEA
jgi:DNA-binding GntR family transcriptional regulator